MLVPVRYLLNGATIRQVETATGDYRHLEVDHHDAVLAEGSAAETYLDTGNRIGFSVAATQAHERVARAEVFSTSEAQRQIRISHIK